MPSQPKNNVTLETAIADWRNWLMVAGRSPRTVAGYVWELERFAARHPGRRAGSFTPEDLINYLAARRRSGCGDATVKRTTAALRAFFSHQAGEAASPARALPFPRKITPRRRPRSLSAEQANQVLASCETSTARGRRDLALMALMLATGLRAAEVCRLTLDDVDWPSGRFEVECKGGERRAGKFGPYTANLLRWWLEARPEYAAKNVRTVFVGLGGIKRGTPLTTDGLRAIFRTIGAAAGLAAFSPHDLRRSFAHLALRYGAPTRTLQVAGRWDQLLQVETYTREIGLDDFDAYNPVERLLGGPWSPDDKEAR